MIESPRARVATLLLVDDDPLALRLLHAIFGADYALLDAADGEAALDLISQTVPDLVLLDVNLPGIDGFEVCRRIKATGSEVRVLLITARTGGTNQVIGWAAGAADYVVKPYDPRELASRVAALLAEDRPDPVATPKADWSGATSDSPASPIA